MIGCRIGLNLPWLFGTDTSFTSLKGNGSGMKDCGNTIGEGVKGISRVVDVSREVDSVTGDNLSKEGKLTDTSVLDLDVTKTVESFLVRICEEAKRIKESKRRLDSKLVLESHVGGNGTSDL